jgi:hypothetical protein
MTALLDVDQLRTFIAGARSPLGVRLGNALIEQRFSALAGSGRGDRRAHGVGLATAA